MDFNNSRGFASDNNSGIHPALAEAIIQANKGHVVAYGEDPYTLSAIKTMKNIFGDNCEPFFMVTGTGANVTGLASVLQPYQAVICAESSHIHVDECGAPERFCNCKLLTVKTPDGKLTPLNIRQHLHDFGFEHHVQPKAISISQPTELGTVYSPNEIGALSVMAKEYDLYLHMDGARLANAAVSLNLNFREFTKDAGVDILSFGGTKNGMLFGESVIFFDPRLSANFKYIRKQGMQLVSKMRYIAAQFDVYIRENIWKANALHANEMAKRLSARVHHLPGIRVTQQVQSNAVFAVIPVKITQPLQEKYFFYIWDEDKNEVRWMTSFDTQPEDIDDFVNEIGRLLNGSKQ